MVKVESTTRPDGARLGPAAFFDLLHHGQESVALDFRDPDQRAALAELVARADVVIEGSRPRALRQLGITPEAAFAAGRLRCWLSLTAYGRTHRWEHRVGFGDDTAAAAGLVAWDATGPSFCADAVADPLAGVIAAEAVRSALAGGGRWLLDVSLHAAARAAGPVPAGAAWVPGPPTSPRSDGATGTGRRATGCASSGTTRATTARSTGTSSTSSRQGGRCGCSTRPG